MSTKSREKNPYRVGRLIYSPNFKKPVNTYAYCKVFEKLIAEKLNLTYVGGAYDGGIDATDKNGTRYQIKTFIENKPSFTCDGVHDTSKSHIFDEELRKYLKKFDVLVIYRGRWVGEPFDINKVTILTDINEQYEFLFKRAYKTDKNELSNKSQLQFNITTQAFDSGKSTSLYDLYVANGYQLKKVRR